MKLDQTLIPLSPHVQSTVWGGSRLPQLKNLPQAENVGETWEVSIHPKGPSKFQDRPLSDYLSEIELPYLVKFIDTSDNLSVQVHPDDDYAKTHENSQGKTECWIILDAAPGAGIYLGLNEGVNREAFAQGLKANEDMSKFLKFYPVKKGDFFLVPAGSTHSIGKDVFLIEMQQSSGITYRVWDWNRVGLDGLPRELHVKDAMNVINFESDFNQDSTFQIQNNLFLSENKIELIDHPQFKVQLFNSSKAFDGPYNIEILLENHNRASGLVCLEGSLSLQRGKDQLNVDCWQSVLLTPDGEKSLIVKAQNKTSFILVT